MKLKNSILAGCTALVVATSCTQRAVEKQTWVEKAIENRHTLKLDWKLSTIESSGRISESGDGSIIRVVSIIADTLTGGSRLFPRQCMVFV